MSYSAVAAIRTESPFKDSVSISDAYVTQKIAEADGIINSLVGEAYELPLSSTPDIIVNISKALTIGLLFQEQNTNIEVEPGLSVADYIKAQMDMLSAISSRKIKLFDSSGDELPVRDSALPSSYPNATSSDPSATNSTAPKITMNKRF